MKVIVGLGNPGSRYQGTRHNVGFEVVDYLAQAPGVEPFRSKFQGQITELRDGMEPVLLIKPETFMNLSGRCVRQVLDFYKVPVSGLLVISDDINLPVGKLRVRPSGSSGGQNGLKNIQECLGTDGYTRLRIGVGSPVHGEAVDYVLGRFKPSEQKAIEDAVARAAQGAWIWVRQGVEPCMNHINGGGAQRPKPPRAPRPPRTANDKTAQKPEPNRDFERDSEPETGRDW